MSSSPTSGRSTDDPPPSRSYSSSNQYPFPHNEASQRPGLGPSQHSRRTSAANSITSIGGILETTPQGRPGSIVESGRNAISTLLIHPIVRSGLLPHTSGPSAHKPPSSRDIPPVTLTNIPHIDSSAFKLYLSQAGSLYDALRRAKDGEDGGVSAGRKGSKTDAGPADALVHGVQRRPSATPSLSSSASGFGMPLEASLAKRRSSGGVPRRAGLTVAPLSTIPPVYFEQDFHLENPRTFDIVSERSEIVRPPGPNGSASGPGSSGKKALATNAILQEKLSWYMDTVEIHLISSISTASTSFFAALGSLRELHSDAADSATKIKTLREDLSKLDEDMAAGGLRIMALKRRRENMRKLGDAVHQLKEIIDTVRQCEEQVDRGDIEIALKGLTNVERLMAGDPEDLEATAMGRKPLDHRGELIDLRGLKALDGAGNDIAFLRKKIGKAFEAKFMDTLMGDLKRHIDAVSSNSTFQRFDTASNRLRGNYVQTPTEFPAYLHVDGAFRGALLAQLKGLARSDSIMPAAMTYREAILKEFKNLIRRHLPSSSDEDAESTTSIATHESRHFSQQERSSILARNLRALDPDDAEEMFKKIYANVGEALRRLGTQVKVLLDITSSLGSPHPVLPIRSPRTPFILSMNGYMNAEPSPGPPPALVRQEEIQQALDLSSLLGQAVDIAQVQINKILRVRSEQTTHLDVNHFLRYFTLNRLFADECEAVSGRGGSALKTVVNDHIKAFVNYLGETERRRLLQGMDVDRWDAKDFTEADAKRLSMIIDASTTEVAAWTKATVIWDDGTAKPSSAQPNGISNGSKPTSGVTVNTSESSRSIQPANSDSLPTQSDCLPAKDDALPTKEKIRSAVIDEQKFILPESAMTVASGIEVFEQLLTGIPSMSQEIAGSLLEYLKLFNSRSSQLILGAGATLSAGLKNITTKHLALSSQALSFVIALIPHIREFVRRYSPNSNLLAEFDRVKRLFQEHQSGIHDKLVDIMSGRAAAHVSAMKKIDWDATSTTNAGVNTYMETLIRETTTLHKVLSKHLPEATVQTIMLPVMANYRERWGRAFGELVLKTLDGKQRLVRDVEFLRNRITKLDGAGDIGDFLVDIVNDKHVEAVVPVPSSTRSSSSEPAQTNGAVGESNS